MGERSSQGGLAGSESSSAELELRLDLGTSAFQIRELEKDLHPGRAVSRRARRPSCSRREGGSPPPNPIKALR